MVEYSGNYGDYVCRCKEISSRTIRISGALIVNSVVDPGCLSRIRLFSIPDPGSELSPSRILIREFKYLNPKKSKKMVSKH
jgi:hypothetical protein